MVSSCPAAPCKVELLLMVCVLAASKVIIRAVAQVMVRFFHVLFPEMACAASVNTIVPFCVFVPKLFQSPLQVCVAVVPLSVPPTCIVTDAVFIVLALHVNVPVMLVAAVTVRSLLVMVSESSVVSVPAVTVKLLSTPSE